MSNEHDDMKVKTAANSAPAAGGAAGALARVQELCKADPAYVETLGVSKRGMDFFRGAEATLRATGAGAQEV